MSLRQHIDEVLRIEPMPSPWPRMFVCAFATAFPLVIGSIMGQLPVAIFGSLMGFLLPLNDHLGTLGHRLWTITLTFLMMAAGLSLGILTHQHNALFIPVLLGLMGGGKGAELERALLFSIFQVLAGAYSGALEQYFVPIVSYAFLGYLCVVITLAILVFLHRHNPNPFARLRTTLKESITAEKSRHLYAAGYALAILFSLIAVHVLKVDHGYWGVGTVLIIMRPEIKQSVYRSIQRFLGALVDHSQLVLLTDVFRVQQIFH